MGVIRHTIAITCLALTLSVQGQDSISREQQWAVALPIVRYAPQIQVGDDMSLHPVGAPFYMGFRAAIDSLNQSQDSLRVTLDVYQDWGKHYAMFSPAFNPVDTAAPPFDIHVVNTTNFHWMLNGRVDYLIGPLRQSKISELASHDGSYRIINPLSSYALDLDSAERVISLTPESKEEMAHLGGFVVQCQQGVQDSTDSLGLALTLPSHMVFLLPEAPSTKFKERLEAFQAAYKSTGGDSTKWSFVDLSNPSWETWSVWQDSTDVLIYADLEQIDMFKFYNVVRQRNPDHTYMIYGSQTINNTVQMPSVVLKFPFLWAQNFRFVDRSMAGDLDYLWQTNHTPPNKWTWLGYDAAMTTWKLAFSDTVDVVGGPRRVMVPELNAGGYRSIGIYRYVYIPGKGFFDGHLQSLNLK